VSGQATLYKLMPSPHLRREGAAMIARIFPGNLSTFAWTNELVGPRESDPMILLSLPTPSEVAHLATGSPGSAALARDCN